MRKAMIIVSLLVVISIMGLVFFDNYDSGFSNTKVVQYNGSNLMISVNGNVSSTLPSGDFYLASYECKSANTVLNWDRNTGSLEISNGTGAGGVSCYVNFESTPKLADMSIGSYISYVGDNGCVGDACSGMNAHYVNDNDMGYCLDSNYKYYVNGWRLAYVEDGSAYLISAGSPECLCTNSSGENASSCDSYEGSNGASVHLSNLNRASLKYCNKNYVFDGICNSASAWNMKAFDFKKIVGNSLNATSCYKKTGDKNCGYSNELIDNGSYYWVATPENVSASFVFDWNAKTRTFESLTSLSSGGLRPVLRLDSNVVVTNGSGTYDDPFIIANNTFWIQDGSASIGEQDKSSVELSLIGVNIQQMCISVNTSVCTDYVDFSEHYTLDWSTETFGNKVVYVYYKDANGRIVAAMNKSVMLNES